MKDLDYLRIAFEQARLSVKQGGFPAGAVIVKDDQIIAKGISIGNVLHDPTAHAENVSVRKACKALQSTDLQGTTLYASLEPCLMCFCSANWAGVKRIVYGYRKEIGMVKKHYYEGRSDIQDINSQNNHQIELVFMPDVESEMRALIVEWEKQFT